MSLQLSDSPSYQSSSWLYHTSLDLLNIRATSNSSRFEFGMTNECFGVYNLEDKHIKRDINQQKVPDQRKCQERADRGDFSTSLTCLCILLSYTTSWSIIPTRPRRIQQKIWSANHNPGKKQYIDGNSIDIYVRTRFEVRV